MEDLEGFLTNSRRADKDGNETKVQLTKDDEFYLVRYYGEYGGVTMPGEIGQIFEQESQDNTQEYTIFKETKMNPHYNSIA